MDKLLCFLLITFSATAIINKTWHTTYLHKYKVTFLFHGLPFHVRCSFLHWFLSLLPGAGLFCPSLQWCHVDFYAWRSLSVGCWPGAQSFTSSHVSWLALNGQTDKQTDLRLLSGFSGQPSHEERSGWSTYFNNGIISRWWNKYKYHPGVWLWEHWS